MRVLSEEQKEKARKRAHLWRLAHPQRVRDRARKWVAEHPEWALSNVKKWQAANQEKVKQIQKKYERNNREKKSAHAAVRIALKNGKIKKLPCEVCARFDDVEAHHDDYKKKLNVRWLCPKHHAEHHRNLNLHNRSNVS